jgi:uncharacterized protein YbjT (DUF2867 family)
VRRILIVGSTGNVGGKVLSQLMTTEAQVRVLVRNPEGARFSSQVEIVCGDLTLPETLDACLDGIDSVFLVWTASPATIGAALAADREERSARCVSLSSAEDGISFLSTT